jgi:hypothetical protein
VMISLTKDGAALKEKATSVPYSFKCSLGLTPEEMLSLRDTINIILDRTKQINK